MPASPLSMRCRLRGWSVQRGAGVALALSCASAAPRAGEAPSAGATSVLGGEAVTQLALGAYHTCALVASGRVACWGDNQRGQLGQDELQLSAVPVWVPGMEDVVELRASDGSTCARRRSGAVFCWGDNAHGEVAPHVHGVGLANATAGAHDRSGEPAKYAPGNVQWAPAEIQVFAGRACAWSASGEVLCWGDSGACADTAAPTPPTPVADYRDSLGIARAAGGCFWCSIRPSHELSCDMPPPERGHMSIARVREVAAGNEHACAIREGGDAWCWGSNVRGELGRVTADTRDLSPAPVQWQGPQPAEPETP